MEEKNANLWNLHPSKTMYNETELIHYLTDIMDDFLEIHPDGLVVYGGDLNRLDIKHLQYRF